MSTLHEPRANMHCRKRSFEIALENEATFRVRPQRHVRHGLSPRSMTFPVSSLETCTSKRRLKTSSHSPSMPVHTTSVMSTNYPSFMSVYGSNESSFDPEQQIEIHQVSQKEQDFSLGQPNNNTAARINHTLPFAITHRGSINSLKTTSTESSPTTTHSSPMFTDPSPTSSPESASSNPPLSLFKGIMQSTNHDRESSVDQMFPRFQQTHPSLSQPDLSNAGPRSRIPKNLTINMSTITMARPAASNGVDGRHPLSEPTSPFKEPLRSARKKPTNLTIRTPGFNQLNFARNTPDVPPTPSSKPSLQNFQSSPSLHSLITPTTSSSGGLHLSLPPFGHSRPGSDSSVSSQSATSQLPGLKETDEPHKSQETQERGYPDGPVLIYDCGLYLYLEPTAEEARQFDTVINVAKEVKNPYEHQPAPSKSIVSILRGEGNRSNSPEPQTAASEKSFKSAWEYQPMEAPTPTTPKAESSPTREEPEYIHVDWDHNSEILQDLFPLCQLIDDRISQGKKVLVHCQLGVSRSASLVIAYGLYKGYQPDFHSMYMQVKSRSRWVGPNMSLIYQLTDFRGKVIKGEQSSRLPPARWFQNSTVASPAIRTPFQAMSLHGDGPELVKTYPDDSTNTPQTARPIRSLRLDKELPPVPLFTKRDMPKTTSHIVNQYTATPASSETALNDQPSVQVEASIPKKAFEPRPLPFRKLAEYSQPQTIPPHRPRDSTLPRLIEIPRPPSQMDLASQDVPRTPSMFSPRATEFMTSPFGISSTVGDLAFSGLRSARSVRSISPPAGEVVFANVPAASSPVPSTVDPRSPHQQDDPGEILRHIDDFL